MEMKTYRGVKLRQFGVNTELDWVYRDFEYLQKFVRLEKAHISRRVNRALLRVYRALLRACKALLSVYTGVLSA